MMLRKILGNKKCNNQSRAPSSASGPVERKSRALKIVHAGGHAERYYMAISAATIMDKHPSFVLARPEIFRRPWESVVRADETLVPGHKYYLVPRQTVKKLRRRIKKTSSATDGGFSFDSKPLVENASREKDSLSGILVKPGVRVKARNQHVRFFGIESTNQKPACEKKIMNEERGSKDEKKRRARNEHSWEPSLDAINE